MTSTAAVSRARYLYWLEIPTRWQDGDPYGHVNNVVYYSWIDTLLTRMLLERRVLRDASWNGIGLCVESGCQFLAPVTFPEPVSAGLRIARMGTTSLRYEVGLFVSGREAPAAVGYFVHVFVDPDSRRPVSLPEHIRLRIVDLVLPGT